MDFGVSFNSKDSNTLEVVPEAVNTLEIKYNDFTMISCTDCDSDIQLVDDILTINYRNINLPELVADSLVDAQTGGNVSEALGGMLQQQLDILIVFKKT
jgi:hypothetical protein